MDKKEYMKEYNKKYREKQKLEGRDRSEYYKNYKKTERGQLVYTLNNLKCWIKKAQEILQQLETAKTEIIADKKEES